MARTDILLDNDFDLIDEGTEWAEGESDEQHVELLVLLGKGELKEFPHSGVGINGWLKKRAINPLYFKRNVEVELENDGYTNPVIDIENGIQNLKITI